MRSLQCISDRMGLVFLLVSSICWASSLQAAVRVLGVEDPAGQLAPTIREGTLLEGWRADSQDALRPLNTCVDWWHVRDEHLPRGNLQLSVVSNGMNHVVEVDEGQWRLVVSSLDGMNHDARLSSLVRERAYKAQAEFLTSNDASSPCALLEASEALRLAGDFASGLAHLDRVSSQDFGSPHWGKSLLLRHQSDLALGRRDFSGAHQLANEALHLEKAAGYDVSAALAVNTMILSAVSDPAIPNDFELLSEALSEVSRIAPGSVVQARLLLSKVRELLASEAFAQGVDTALQAQAILETRTPSGDWLHVAVNIRGVMLWYQGKLREAADVYRKVLAMPGLSTFRYSQAQNNLGLALVDLGFYAEAEAVLQEQLRKLEARGEKLRAVFVLINLGISMNEQGDFELAAAYYDKALRYQEELEPGTMQTARILNNYGGNQRHLEKYEESRSFLLRAQAIADKQQPGSTLAGAIREGLSDVELDYGNLDSALAMAQEAYRLHLEGDHGALRGARVKYRIGMIERLRGNLDRSESLHREALFVRRQLQPDTGFVAQSLNQLALIALARGDEGSARLLACEAVEVLEIQRKRTGSNAARGSRFNEAFGPIFQFCLERLVHAGQTGEAMAILEQSRAASLLSLLAERDLILDAELPQDLRERRAAFTNRYETLQQQLASMSVAQEEQRRKLEAEIQETEQERASLINVVRQSSPRLADLEYPKPLDANDIKGQMESDASYLAYAVGESNTVLFGVGPALAGKKQRDLISMVLPLGRQELASRVRAFRELLSTPSSALPGLQAEAAALYTNLLHPAEALLAHSERLIISPDGPLLELPFEALVRGQDASQQYLIERLPVSYTLSATVYSQLKDLPAAQSDRVIAFANPAVDSSASDSGKRSETLRQRLQDLPPLPAAADEVRSISGHFGASSSAYIGPEATEYEAKQMSGDAHYLHFAVHGLLNKTLPLSSALLLGGGLDDDGLLHAWEIFESVRTNADLVTLSACETGLGKTVSGEGMIGLVRAFQYAGARNIVASLWRVSDRSTATLMNQFYGQLRQGLRKDESLRLAKLNLIQGGDPLNSQTLRAIGGMTQADANTSSHPFYWAAFQLQR